MRVSRRAVAAAVVTAVAAGAAGGGMTAFGDDAGGDGTALLATDLAPSVPADPALHGVAPGAAPWVVRRGEARLRGDGRLEVGLRGLVIPTPPASGTPGPVTTVSASLFCGADAAPAGTTDAVPISRGGDARIAGRVSLPSKCLGPVVVVHPNGNRGLYIAASGF